MVFKKMILALIALLFIGAAAFAQNDDEVPQPEQQKEPQKKTDIMYNTRIGGVLWMNYHVRMDYASAENTFEIERAYLYLTKRFNDYFSANLVWDVVPQLELATDGSYKSSKYNTYLRIANVSAMRTFGPVKLGIKGGLIDTPYSYASGRSGDYHMNGDPLEQVNYDPLYDLGIGITAKMYEYVDFYFAITEGEGYKNIYEKKDAGKAYSARLSLVPFVKGLAIDWFGYINLADGKHQFREKYAYTGAGISYKTPLVKVGANYLHRFIKSADSTVAEHTQNGDWIIDFWLNTNLESVTSFPFLLWVMFDYYYDNKANGSYSFNTSTYYEIGGGFGYKPLEDLEVNIFYKYHNAVGSDQENIFYVKTAVKF